MKWNLTSAEHYLTYQAEDLTVTPCCFIIVWWCSWKTWCCHHHKRYLSAISAWNYYCWLTGSACQVVASSVSGSTSRVKMACRHVQRCCPQRTAEFSAQNLLLTALHAITICFCNLEWQRVVDSRLTCIPCANSCNINIGLTMYAESFGDYSISSDCCSSSCSCATLQILKSYCTTLNIAAQNLCRSSMLALGESYCQVSTIGCESLQWNIPAFDLADVQGSPQNLCLLRFLLACII